MSPQHILVLSAVLFTMGVFGVLWNRGAITILMCVELMLNAGNLAFIAFSLCNEKRGSASDRILPREADRALPGVASSVLKKLAPARSILFTKAIRGT